MSLRIENGTEPLDTIVLAGSVNKIPLFPGNQPGRKALVEMLGKPLIAYTLDALRGARGVGRIVVVGAPEVIRYAQQWPDVHGVPEGKSLIENARRGLEAGQTPRVLFCNPDQPLLRSEMVEDFLQRALQVSDRADVVLSWVKHDAIGRYEAAEHKFAPFGDGCYTHGNLYLLRQDLPDLKRVRQRLDGLYRARKNVVRFAWALGPELFARFAWAKLRGKFPSLQEVQDLTAQHFGIKLAGIFSPYVEIALDIDEPEDYAAAAKYLELDRRAPAPVLKAA